MAEALSLTTHAGLMVQPYRNDRSENAWVFRCWGTDTCDGWLSLDHASEQSAVRALVAHTEEFHSPKGTTPDVKVGFSGGLTDLQRREVERIIKDHIQRAAHEIRRRA